MTPIRPHNNNQDFSSSQKKRDYDIARMNLNFLASQFGSSSKPIKFDTNAVSAQSVPQADLDYRSQSGESPDPLQGTPEPQQLSANSQTPVKYGTEPIIGSNIIRSDPGSSSHQRVSLPALTPNASPSTVSLLPPPPGAVIEVNQSPYQLPAEPQEHVIDGAKFSGKHQRQYVMPDGRVINGKGLGRGRPGVKRGPRRSMLASEVKESDGASAFQESVPPTTPTLSTEAVKRKRTSSNASALKSSESATSPVSRQSTPEYNPTSTQTRSGRQSQKPVSIVTTSTSASSPTAKRQSGSNLIQSPSIKKHPKIKAKIYRGREQFALCEHCLRGYGPPGNVIVFCDACNKCWHQNCHAPRISKEVVADTKAEWFCTDCDRILHGKKKQKIPETQNMATTPTKAAGPSNAPQFGPPLVGAVALPVSIRKQYLHSLSKERLIDLILRAGDLAPQLPMFETPLPPPQKVPLYVAGPDPQFASTYITPVDTARPAAANASEMDDEGYDDSFDEHAALYPKPGEGVKLPPDDADLHMLLEGPDSKTFSHWIRGTPMRMAV